jgi:hypothetical protein
MTARTTRTVREALSIHPLSCLGSRPTLRPEVQVEVERQRRGKPRRPRRDAILTTILSLARQPVKSRSNRGTIAKRPCPKRPSRRTRLCALRASGSAGPRAARRGQRRRARRSTAPRAGSLWSRCRPAPAGEGEHDDRDGGVAGERAGCRVLRPRRHDRATRRLDGDLGLLGLRADVADEVRRRRADDQDRREGGEHETGLVRGTGMAAAPTTRGFDVNRR